MKKMGLVVVFFIFLSFTLLCHMQKLTQLATLQMELASLHQTYLLLEEESKRLEYQVEAIHDPCFLIEVSQSPRFAHLSYANKLEMAVVDHTSNKMEINGIAVACK